MATPGSTMRCHGLPQHPAHLPKNSLYRCFDRRTDALFELTNAVLTAGVVTSPVHLSLQPFHRRGWGRLYAALSRGSMNGEAMRKLVARYPLAEDRTAARDHSQSA